MADIEILSEDSDDEMRKALAMSMGGGGGSGGGGSGGGGGGGAPTWLSCRKHNFDVCYVCITTAAGASLHPCPLSPPSAALKGKARECNLCGRGGAPRGGGGGEEMDLELQMGIAASMGHAVDPSAFGDGGEGGGGGGSEEEQQPVPRSDWWKRPPKDDDLAKAFADAGLDAAADDTEVSAAAALAAAAPEVAVQPSALLTPLLPFQLESLAWMVAQEASPMRGGVLADEMGMGKTIQAIALVCAQREEAARVALGAGAPPLPPWRAALRPRGGPPPYESEGALKERSEWEKKEAKAAAKAAMASAKQLAASKKVAEKAAEKAAKVATKKGKKGGGGGGGGMSSASPAASPPPASVTASEFADFVDVGGVVDLTASQFDSFVGEGDEGGGSAALSAFKSTWVPLRGSENPLDSLCTAPRACGATLIVCPVIALTQWRGEILRHCEHNAFKVLIYHGPNREALAGKLAEHDVVLTTYSCLEAEFRKMLAPTKEECKWCGKRFLPAKLVFHLKYFCGPDAKKTEKQAKQERRRGGGGGGGGGGRFQDDEDDDEDDEEEEHSSTESEAPKKTPKFSAKKTPKSSAKKTPKSSSGKSGGGGKTSGSSGKGSAAAAAPKPFLALSSSRKLSAPPKKGAAGGKRKRSSSSEEESDEEEEEEEEGSTSAEDDDDGDDDTSSEGGGSSRKPRGRATAAASASAAAAVPRKKSTRALGPTGPLQAQHWTRLILDEAHAIKNKHCATAKACYALTADTRWCLTGTPLQNRVSELASMISFLRVKPYAHQFCKNCPCLGRVWRMGDDGRSCVLCGHSPLRHYWWLNRLVLNPVRQFGHLGPGADAMRLLRGAVLSSMVLRRTKAGRAADLTLPARVIRIRGDLTLDRVERDYYNALYTQTEVRFGAYAAAGTLLQNYAHLFELLTRLRQAVNHPFLIEYGNTAVAAAAAAAAALPPPMTSSSSASSSAAAGGGAPALQDVCGICWEAVEDPVITRCRHIFCRTCLREVAQAGGARGGGALRRALDRTTDDSAWVGDVEGDEGGARREEGEGREEDEEEEEEGGGGGGGGGGVLPSCPTCLKPLSVDLSSPADVSAAAASARQRKGILARIPAHRLGEGFQSSTKIEALAEELWHAQVEEPGCKAIVFSQFVSFLDLVQYRLNRGGMRAVKLDGSLSVAARDKVITEFRDAAGAAVLLISLKAGGVALNLTAASRVFLMDLWWNPAAEMQAMDRTHRLGQHRSITVTRFVVADTVEERILALQEKKRLVFDATVGAQNDALAKLTEEDMRCKSRAHKITPPLACAQLFTSAQPRVSLPLSSIQQVLRFWRGLD
jgi:DNA repair protein RAD16